MFSALMVLISGNILSGLVLIGILLLFSASYIILTRSGSRYPTNLCVLTCILCAIATDVVWSLFNFGSDPVLSVYGQPGPYLKLFYEFLIAGVIFFCGLTLTNIIKNRVFRKTKIALFSLLILALVALSFNLLVIKFTTFKVVFPGTTLLQTNIALICAIALLVIVLSAFAVAGRGEKSKMNIATVVILVLLTICAAALGIYKCVKDGAEAPGSDVSSVSAVIRALLNSI